MTSNTSNAESVADSPLFPEAEIQPGRQVGSIFAASRMWLATLFCLVAALTITWLSIGSTGPQIAIHFEEGHGIKPGDALRHRGIDVGEVTAVELQPDLAGIEVRVALHPQAATLARADTRFWIVRPQVSLSGVSGLDTALGAKYIAVDPSDASEVPEHDFRGLPTPPPHGFRHEGIQLLLRAHDKQGVSVGAPVTYRGVDVGQVLSVDLAPDALSVDVQVRIDTERRYLLQPNSKFWVNSGIDFNVGITGIHWTADSLSTVARGGVAFITPQANEDDQVESVSIAEGDIFILHDKPEESWLKPLGSTTAETIRRWLRRESKKLNPWGAAHPTVHRPTTP